MSALLRADGLTLRQGDRCLLRELELAIHPRECWIVIGPNGCGKTTLLKTLAGLQPPVAGRIRIQGESLDALSPRQRALRLGLLFQHGNRGLHNSTLELVMSGHHPHRRHWWDTPAEIEASRHALAQVGLEGLAGQDTQTLSGGELRRAEIARLLVQDPALAMLDEPFNHLDIGQQVAMLRLLRRHFTREGRALLMVAHDLNMALETATHLLLVQGDGGWKAGPASEVARRETLSRLFGHPLQEYRGPGGVLWGASWE